MAEWTCAACGTHNDPSRQTCMVCSGYARAAPEPPSHPAAPGATAGTDPRPAAAPMTPGRFTTSLPTPAPVPAATPRLRTGVLVLLVLAALSGGGFLVNSQLNRGDNGTTGAGSGLGTVSGGGSGSGTSPSTLPADRPSEDPSIEPEPEPAVAGPVTVGEPGELAGRVAAMFEIYFGGINDGDAGRALSVVEPSTKLDPSDPEDVENFRRDISTTHDDDIRLGSVVDTGATISAGLTFRSRQDAGYGPRGEADQTCTRWTMRYSLADDGGALRIRAVTAKHTGC